MEKKISKLERVIGKNIIDKIDEIDEVNEVLYEYINYLDNVYAKDFTTTTYEIHEKLPYYCVKSEMFIKYYKLEYLSALVKMSLQKGIDIDSNIINFIDHEFLEIENLLYKCIEGSARVWLIRELYYLENNLMIKNRHTQKEIHEFLYNLYKGTRKRFKTSLYDDTVNYENKTDIYLYIRTRYNFTKIIKSAMPIRAKINLLVNLSHNNGILADKMMRDCSAEKLLSDLSKGYFTKEIEREFFLLTKIRFDYMGTKIHENEKINF